jgi:hypothetical protein
MHEPVKINMAIVAQLIQFAKHHYVPFDTEANTFRQRMYAPKHHANDSVDNDDASFPDNAFINALIEPFEKEKSFNEVLFELLDRHYPTKDEKATEVYKRVGIKRSHWSKMLSNREYQPNKDTIFKLIFAFELNLEDTNRLLASAGYAFNRSQYKDLVILAAVTHHIYLLKEVDESLHQFAKTTLFSDK